MSIRDAANQAFPPVLTSIMLAVFGVLVVLDWVQLARGDKDTKLTVTAAATALWLAATTSGVLLWTS